VARFVDPFEEMDRMFGQFGGRWRNGGMMPMDAFESDGVYTLRFDLAGADPDAVDVTVEHGVLTITAERPVEETEGVNWLVRERPTGTHSRQVRLGDRLDAANIDAQYDHGVLTVTIPIRPEAKPHKVSIRSGNESQTIEAESTSA
jgi:HSP20 family protein